LRDRLLRAARRTIAGEARKQPRSRGDGNYGSLNIPFSDIFFTIFSLLCASFRAIIQ
jgi:hypothetical protein